MFTVFVDKSGDNAACFPQVSENKAKISDDQNQGKARSCDFRPHCVGSRVNRAQEVKLGAMCGRITQHRDRRVYAQEMGWDSTDQRQWQGGRTAFYNLAPGAYPDVMHTFDQGKPEFETIFWGYQPSWAAEKKLPMSINARLETAATKPFFRHMFREGRVIVPADGWFEWTGEKGHKQPWYVRLKSDRPMFLAAISNFRPYKNQEGKQVGVVIVTAPADSGLIDVHDRRPVVLKPEDAQLWMDNTLPAEQADMLARQRAVPAEEFEWYRVSTDVNKVGKNEEYFIEPV